jgi:hypothetical protein
MRYVLWTIRIAVVLAVGLLLHWSLPSRDIVRITGTDVVRIEVEETNARGEHVTRSRDRRLVNTVKPNGEPHVYRNEDTGWGLPPYFKFDSADLAAEAEDLVSTRDAPRWVVVTHYGWRLTFLSIFPNAVAIEPAEGPDQTLIPWFNIVVVGIVAVLLLLLRARLRRLVGLD